MNLRNHEDVRIHPRIVEFIMRTMPQWRRNLGLRHMMGNIEKNKKLKKAFNLNFENTT